MVGQTVLKEVMEPKSEGKKSGGLDCPKGNDVEENSRVESGKESRVVGQTVLKKEGNGAGENIKGGESGGLE